METALTKQILLRIAAIPGVRVWRNNSGVAEIDGRVVRFGIQGQGDITGLIPGGRRLEIEVKTATGRQSLAQKSFERMIRSHGGVYILARSADAAAAELEAIINASS